MRAYICVCMYVYIYFFYESIFSIDFGLCWKNYFKKCISGDNQSLASGILENNKLDFLVP